MPKRYNTPHRSRVVKTRLSEDEYADFTARLAPYGISQSEFLRQAIRRTAIRPIIHVSAVNDKLCLQKLPTYKTLQAEYAGLLAEKKKAYAEYAAAKKEMQAVLTAKANVDRLLGAPPERPEQEKEQAQR